MDAVAYIKHFEGFVPRLYLCPAGYPTVGYGTRVATWNVGDPPGWTGPTGASFSTTGGFGGQLRHFTGSDKGNWLTEEQATALMMQAVYQCDEICSNAFGEHLWVWLTEQPGGSPGYPPRVVALTDLAYNMGGFSKFPRFVAAVQARDWQRAHDELLWVGGSGGDGVHMNKTRYYKQTGKRAECNAQILLTGAMPEVLP